MYDDPVARPPAGTRASEPVAPPRARVVAELARAIDGVRFGPPDGSLAWLAVVLSTAALGIAAVALAMAQDGGVSSLDLRILRAIASVRTESLDRFFRAVHALQTPALVIVIGGCAAVFVWRRRWWNAATLLVVIPGGMLANSAGKWFIQRGRPDLPRLVAAHGYSFPSGHVVATTLACLYLLTIVFLATTDRAIRFVAITVAGIVIALVAVSRPYLHVHYPSDSIGAVLAGIAWTSTILLAAGAIERASTPRGFVEIANR